MSDPTVTATPVPASAPLSNALKSSLLAAAEAHLATESNDVSRVKAAIQADLPSVSATAISIEALVKTEFDKLKADVGSVWKPWMSYAAVGVVAVAGTFAVHLAHLF